MRDAGRCLCGLFRVADGHRRLKSQFLEEDVAAAAARDSTKAEVTMAARKLCAGGGNVGSSFDPD